MRSSVYFYPTLKETPQEAQIASHRLMLRSGMITQVTSGIYTWLPLGLKGSQENCPNCAGRTGSSRKS